MTMPALGSRAVGVAAATFTSDMATSAAVVEAKFSTLSCHVLPSSAWLGCLSTSGLAAACRETGGFVSSSERSCGGSGSSSSSLLVLGRAGGAPRPFIGSSAPRFPRRQLEDNRMQNEDRSSTGGPLKNGQIRVPSVRLVDEEQNMVGVMPTQEALQRSRGLGMDLVLIAPDAEPPVAKIMDYSKFKYESSKRKREQQKKASANRVELKELKMRYNIDTHDYDVRLRAAQRFLRDSDKVKVVIQFKGREMEFKELGKKLLKRFEEDLGDHALIESTLTMEGRSMMMIFAPNKLVLQKLQAPSAAVDGSKLKSHEVAKVEA